MSTPSGGQGRAMRPVNHKKKLEVFQNSQGPSIAMPGQHEQEEVPEERRIEGQV